MVFQHIQYSRYKIICTYKLIHIEESNKYQTLYIYIYISLQRAILSKLKFWQQDISSPLLPCIFKIANPILPGVYWQGGDTLELDLDIVKKTILREPPTQASRKGHYGTMVNYTLFFLLYPARYVAKSSQCWSVPPSK